MKSLIVLEKALLEENISDVSAYLVDVDRKTANDAMKKAGKEFGFKTLEANGMVVADMASASKILGYADITGLSKLLSAYQIMTFKIGWYGDELRSKFREFFNLHEKDSKATFITWDAFLVAGMYGQNTDAKKVKIYLLGAERAYRINLATKDIRDSEKFEMEKTKMITKLVDQIGKTMDVSLLTLLYAQLDKWAGYHVPRPKQIPMDYEQGLN